MCPTHIRIGNIIYIFIYFNDGDIIYIFLYKLHWLKFYVSIQYAISRYICPEIILYEMYNSANQFSKNNNTSFINSHTTFIKCFETASVFWNRKIKLRNLNY